MSKLQLQMSHSRLQFQLIETLTLQPSNTLDATRKEVNAGRVQPKEDIFWKGVVFAFSLIW